MRWKAAALSVPMRLRFIGKTKAKEWKKDEKRSKTNVGGLLQQRLFGAVGRLSGRVYLQYQRAGFLECTDRQCGSDEPAPYGGAVGGGLRYLFPLLSFALGVFLAERVQNRYKYAKSLHWRQGILLAEIFILFLVGFLPPEWNMAATALVSFSCAMQVQAFRKVDGYSYASTMCIGNLRSGTAAFSVYLREKKPEQLRQAVYYFGIIALFALGAGIGGNLSARFGIHMIWFSCALLLVSFF